MGVKVPQTHVVTYPTGEYRAKIESITEKEGEYGPQLQFAFRIVDSDPNVSPVLGWASKTFSNKSKLYLWTRAVFGGAKIPEEYMFDSDDLVNREVILVLVIRTRDDGTTFDRVDSLQPVPAEKGEGDGVPDNQMALPW